MKPMKPMTPMKPLDFGPPWWPAQLGEPQSSGGQNELKYAYFAGPKRLAVQRDGVTNVYDTGEHQITGVSQQQSGERRDDPTFSSQHGTVKLHELKRV